MRHLFAIVIALAVFAVGCAKPEAQILGKWQIDTSSVSTGDAQKDAMAKSLAPSMTMEFKADKTFTGPMMEGTYDISGHAVTMKTTKVMGMDISKFPGGATSKNDQSATLSDDGKTLTISSGKQPVKFTKSS